MQFDNERQVKQYVEEIRAASEDTRRDLVARAVIDRAYYAGAQWISTDGMHGSARMGRLLTSMNPDKSKLRVTMNRVTRNVILSVSATHPSRMRADVHPAGKRSSINDQHVAKLIREVVDGSVDATGVIGAMREANHRRCIEGTYGVGLRLMSKTTSRDVEGRNVELPDIRVKPFIFPAYRLCLDPANNSPSLLDHDVVMYSDIWTKEAAEKSFGIELKDEDLAELGQLAGHELEMHRLVGGILFDNYRRNSRRKGVRVHQIHVQGESGRHDQMFIVLQTREDMRVINADDPESPFGGSGLPLVLIRGHKRPDVPWGLSDVSMLKADQDVVNLHATLYHRIMQVSGHPKWLVDVRSLHRSVSAEEVHNRLTNQVGGVIPLDMGRKDENRQVPTVINTPGPQPFVTQVQQMHELAMRDQVFRAPGHTGQIKSHVPDSSFQRALDEADAPLGIRVEEDVEAYGQLLTVLAGTQIKAARMQSYSTLVQLNKLGFDEMDLGTLLQTNPDELPVVIKVRESSVRYRSQSRKREDLERAVASQAVTATEYRLAMAQNLDTPISDDDEYYAARAQKIAIGVLLGGEWQGAPVGQIAGGWIVHELQKALLDERADPQAQQRLMQAIQAQQQANMQDMIANNPELAMQQQQQAASAPAETVTLEDFLGSTA